MHNITSNDQKLMFELVSNLDFKTVTEYFDYMIESHINGQIKQCKDLFYDMPLSYREFFIRAINVGEIVLTLEALQFYKALPLYEAV